jgi:S-DNA-T family DNA segregation ATPase FtsK/SpoIIIE
VGFIKKSQVAAYNENIMEHIDRVTDSPGQDMDDEDTDNLLPAAIEVVIEAGQASVSLLQRRLKLGYARAARIVDEMEARGIVGSYEGSKPRQVLISREQYLEMKLSSKED